MRRGALILSLALMLACSITWLRGRARDEGFAVKIGNLVFGMNWARGSTALAIGTADFANARPIETFGWSTDLERDSDTPVSELLHDESTRIFDRFRFRGSV